MNTIDVQFFLNRCGDHETIQYRVYISHFGYRKRVNGHVRRRSFPHKVLAHDEFNSFSFSFPPTPRYFYFIATLLLRNVANTKEKKTLAEICFFFSQCLRRQKGKRCELRNHVPTRLLGYGVCATRLFIFFYFRKRRTPSHCRM